MSVYMIGEEVVERNWCSPGIEVEVKVSVQDEAGTWTAESGGEAGEAQLRNTAPALRGAGQPRMRQCPSGTSCQQLQAFTAMRNNWVS